MKKICLWVLLFFYPFFSAQETAEKSQDLVINPIFIVLGALHVSYDYNFATDQSIGVTGFYQFLEQNQETGGKGNFMLKPQYRYFFGKKPNAGFFVEGFAVYRRNIFDVEQVISTTNGANTQTVSAYETAFGLGFGGGGKWVLKKNIVLEASGGIHRNFTTTKENAVAGLGMLGVGYRF